MQLPDLSLLLIMALFWATYAVLRAYVFKPLGTILVEREKTTATATDTLAKALENEKETLADIDRRLTQTRREAIAARQAARTAANAKRQALLDETREKARLAATAAQAKLDVEVAAARAELARNVRTTAGEIASLALGRRIA
jgi:F0F1-type ATP synthase membrane subunit b/b'